MHTFATRLRQNWKAGLTVALVSIPMSVSLAVAANGTPLMGIITAIWAGLIASLFGGSKFNIVGPTGALSGVLASYALVHGIATLPLLAVCAGLMILVVYVLKWEKYIVFIPASVIHGFTLGVAFIIGLGQFNFAFGLKGLPSHERFIQNLYESLVHIPQADWHTFVVFACGLAFLLLWSRRYPMFPGPILLAPAGILLGFLTTRGYLPLTLQTLFSKFGNIEPNLVSLPHWSLGMINEGLLMTGVTVAVIAILETLISAKIADGMTKTKFNRRREMLGLGLANIASGVAGGLPATAALARTSLNVKSGANSSMSAGFNTVCVAIISLILLPVFKFLPLAIVASILVYIACRMIQTEHFLRLLRHDRLAFGLSLFVAALTIVIDPMIGILVGATVSLLLFVNTLAKGHSEVTINENGRVTARKTAHTFHQLEHQGDTLVYRFAGPLTYINAAPHLEIMQKIHKPHTVIFAFRNLFFLDLDGVDALEEMVEILERKHIRVAFTGMSELIAPVLVKTGLYKRKQREDLVFSSTSEAVKALS